MSISISAVNRPSAHPAYLAWSYIIDARTIPPEQFALILNHLGYEAWAIKNTSQRFGVETTNMATRVNITNAMNTLKTKSTLPPHFRFVLERFDAVIAACEPLMPKRSPITPELKAELKSTLEALQKNKAPSQGRG